jgi:outer membrane protein assembly factor BamB
MGNRVALLCVLMAIGAAGGDWPSFRGNHAAGVADGANLPDKWDGEAGEGILWKVPIPGLAHSSPVVSGGKVYVATAVSSRPDATFKPGLYGAGTASEDHTEHEWRVICLDKKSGEILWQQVAYKGTPKEKRHIKATYANATPATDGRYVVAFFGSQGLYGYDVDGERLWRRDFGHLDVGAYDAPDYEWGTASSPIIHGDLAIVQVDTQGDDFLLAVDVKTGETVWRTPRVELPSWGTPTVYVGKGQEQVVTNASNFIRGYDLATGKELWRLGGSSQITAPTPVFAQDLILVASGRGPERPIFVVRADAEGDITLPEGKTSSEAVVWSKKGRGPYMPTPLIYRGHVYRLGNNGILDAYELETGKEVYRERMPHSGSGFSASPVAADGKLYLSSEDGDMFVIKAGPEFEVIAQNAIGELLMATPAVSDGVMYVRAVDHLFAIGRPVGRVF